MGPNISLFSFKTFSLIYITQSLYRLGFLMTLVLVRNTPFSFLMWSSLSIALSFRTSDFVFMEGLLLSSLLFFVSAPFCSCCTSFINEWVPLDDDWVTALFSMSYFIVSSVSSVIFSKVVFGISDVARKNFRFL